MWTTILASLAGLAGSVFDFLKERHISANTKAMVQKQTAQGIAVDTDQIEKLVRDYHYGSTQAIKDAALAELQRRGAIV